MKTLYCRATNGAQGNGSVTLHIDTIPTLGEESHEAKSLEDVRQIIEATGTTRVMLYCYTLPRHPVPIEDARLNGYINRLLNPKPQRAKAHAFVADPNFNPADYID